MNGNVFCSGGSENWPVSNFAELALANNIHPVNYLQAQVLEH